MDRFIFLANAHGDMYEICREAEKAKKTDVVLFFIKIKQILKKIIQQVNPKYCSRADLFTQICELSELNLAGGVELSYFHAVRRIINRFDHGEFISDNEFTSILDGVFVLAGWFVFYVKQENFSEEFYLSDNDQKLIWPYIKNDIQKQCKNRYALMDKNINPLTLQSPVEIDIDLFDILKKDIFETDEAFVQRINKMDPIHLGYCMFDNSNVDEFTHVIFPIYYLDKNDRIISHPVDAFFIEYSENIPQNIDGELVAKLCVYSGNIFFDYTHVWIKTEREDLISVTTISWQKYKYESMVQFRERIRKLTVLPIGKGIYKRSEYNMEKAFLPIKASGFSYVHSLLDFETIGVYASINLAKQICKYNQLVSLYGLFQYTDSGVMVSSIIIKDNFMGKLFVCNEPDNNVAEQILADIGSAEDKFALGLKYERGMNTDKAILWYKKAEKQGMINAQYKLGVIYAKNKRNYKEAAKWFEKAANKEHKWAQYYLADLYREGKGIPQNYQLAKEWYRRSALQRNKRALYWLDDVDQRIYSGICHYDNEDEETYKKYVEFEIQGYEGAKQALEAINDVEIQKIIGEHYEKKGDWEKIVSWYQKVADQGLVICNIDVQNKIGKYYDKNCNYDKAVRWYRNAAEQGFADAQYNLGNCYYNGNGVEQEYGEAVEWYEKAAEQGYNDAEQALEDIDNADIQNKIGKYYDENCNYDKAVKWYQKAAEQGFADAQYNLGNCYYNGNGVEQEYGEAVEWYEEAAAQGHKGAMQALNDIDNADIQNTIGEYYYNEEFDYDKAVEWYQKAAKQGLAEAQYNLGYCYYYVEEDEEKAIEWYHKAADQGNRDAQYELEEIES